LDTPQQLPCTSVPHLLPYCALVPFVPHRHFQQFVPTRDCLYSTVGISPACTADLFIPWIGGVNLLSSCDLSPLARVVYSYFSRWTTWRIYVDLNFGECLINDLLDIAKKQIRCHINFQKTSKEALANARASSIVGWISVENYVPFHCYHIISNHVTVNRIVVNYRKLAYKISCMWVTSLINSKIDPELLCHMLKHPCKWYWICKPKHSSYDVWLEV
jgi:hypothetical protein